MSSTQAKREATRMNRAELRFAIFAMLTARGPMTTVELAQALNTSAVTLGYALRDSASFRVDDKFTNMRLQRIVSLRQTQTVQLCEA